MIWVADAAVTLGGLTDFGGVWAAAVLTAVMEGAVAAAVLLSAGGYGWLVVRRLAPASAPAFARTTKDLSSRPAQAQAQNNALNNMARQQFVVIVNSVNAAEMRMEAASQTRENR